MIIIKKSLNIICGIFFTMIILLSAYSIVPLIRHELNSQILGIIFSIILIVISYFLSSDAGLEKISRNLVNNKNANIIFCIMTAGLFFIQVLFVIFQDFTPRNDLAYVCQGAENLVTGKPLYENIPEMHKHYFAVYPNNHMLFTVVYGLYKMEYMFTGHITNFLPTILNIISLDISYILMYKTAGLIYSVEKSLVCAFRGMMFTPLITYAAFFYTDSMSMPWITGALYLYIKWRISGNICNMALSGITLAVAYKFKGSAGILIPAVIIDLIFFNNRKKKIINFSLFITMFAIFCIIISSISKNIIGLNDYELDRYRFPLIHWIMMSVDGKGGYCSEDFRYTLSFNGYDNKVDADIARLSAKLSAEGTSGFFNHLVQKIAYTWRDGTYMAGYYNKYGFLKSYGFYIFTALCQFTLIFRVVRRSLSGKEISDNEFILRIMLLGMAVFLMVWETRCRYLVSFFVLFVLI